jgi:hypothetical protein
MEVNNNKAINKSTNPAGNSRWGFLLVSSQIRGGVLVGFVAGLTGDSPTRPPSEQQREWNKNRNNNKIKIKKNSSGALRRSSVSIPSPVLCYRLCWWQWWWRVVAGGGVDVVVGNGA